MTVTKHKQYCVFLGAMLLGLIWSQATKGNETDDKTAIVTAPFVELRTGAGRSFPIFHVIEKNESLTFIHQKTSWIKAETLAGISGWFHESDLAKLVNHEGFQLVSKYSNQAQNRAPEKTWEGGVFSGSFDGADAYSLFVGYHFTKHLSSELIATQTLSNFVESNLVGMQIIHTSLPNKKWRPMMILGAGKIYISPKSTLVLPENRDNDFMKVGIGIKTHFVRGFYFRAEYNAYRQLTQREENVTNDEWKLGFSTLF